MGRAFEYRKARKLKRWGNMARTFTRIGKEIDIAVKAGGPDPANNTRLRILIQNAKAENMPKENVERAIKRAISKDTSDYKEITYEGYAPYGIAIVVEAATDNNTRTVANVRHAFTKFGGSLGTTGSLDFMFDRKCVFKINKPENFDPDEFELEMIDYGVDEIFEDEDGVINLYGSFDAYGNIQKYLEENKYDIVSGPDPANNTRLRILIQNAKAENMPKENVERAIKRAISKDTSDYKEITYEGYAPYGIAIVVEAATDNNTRTVANVRHAFTKFGGSLGTTGSLDFMFDRKCVFKINKPENFDPDEFELEMIDYGVDEIFEDEDGVINLYGSFDAYGNIQKYLEENKYDIVSGEFTRIPTDTKELTPEQRAEVDKILDKLDEDDDVTNVYHNIKED